MVNKRNRQQVGQAGQAGGFVPASYQGTYRPQQGHSAHNDVHGVGGPNQYSRNNLNYQNRKPSGSGKGPKIAIAIVIVVLLGILGALGFYIYKETQKNSINEGLHNNVSKEEMKAIDNELTGMTKFDEPFTVLLLGSDARSDDPDMGARTDTIVLVRVIPQKNIVSMVSIPRDTKITINGVGTTKFNAAYSYGGPSGTIAAVKDLTGIDIDHFAEIDFGGLVGLIDAIGGIDVMVDEPIDDPDAGDITIPAGMQHLNGEAALVFSRSRAYADGDFTRVSNQRKVIEAIIHKGLEAPASDLYGIIKASTEFLTTDTAMDVDFIYSLADQIRHNNDYPVTLYSATIPSSTTTIDGVSYVVADPAGVTQMMNAFLAGEDVSQVAGAVVPAPVEADSSSSNAGSSANAGGGQGVYEVPTYQYQSTAQGANGTTTEYGAAAYDDGSVYYYESTTNYGADGSGTTTYTGGYADADTGAYTEYTGTTTSAESTGGAEAAPAA